MNTNVYERFVQVKPGDLVVDIGASVGIFTCSIIDKKPKMVYCLEPSGPLYETLKKNLDGYNVTIVNSGVSSINGYKKSPSVFFDDNKVRFITFDLFLSQFSIVYIDFLKIDCEGGEYDIFIEQNMNFLAHNVGHIAGELHLSTPEQKEKFRLFRDNYLKRFKHFEIYDVSGTVNITWDLFSEHFLEYYTEVDFYIFANEGLI
jgi:FkbM family methyltransferase